MAEALPDYAQAAGNIREWYHNLRVDHLSPDELDFELNIRSIVIRDDPTYSRRRRSLRDHLKVEKEQQKVIEAELEVNWEETIKYCRRNYDEIFAGFEQNDRNLRVRGKAKLLHFGHRIILLVEKAEGEAEIFLKTKIGRAHV